MNDYPMSNRAIRTFADLPWAPFGLVLDPFAGLGRTWAGMLPPVFSDVIPQIPCAIEADAAALPFPDLLFDCVWTDPPHLIRNDVAHWTKGYARFGHYKNRAELERLWPLWSAEFRRVCAGSLMLKTIDGGDRRVAKREDLRLFEGEWEMVDIVGSKTSPGWSKTVTLYSLWKAK